MLATEQKPGAPNSFVLQVLPWLIGAAGLVVYLVTLNHWVPLNSTALVARASGWSWQPAFNQPLTWVLLYPFRWLPGGWAPLALNLFAAVCASLALALLARSVALLPQDVTYDDPLRLVTDASVLSTPTAWIPPVLAAMLCGLQLTFWEHATSITGAMIDLLLFAYVIRCLLEYRVDEDARWLSRCACVYGVGMANDWAMVCYLPIFLVALVRVTGFGVIYNRALMRRTLLWGLAGLSLYLFLPVVQGLPAGGWAGFWDALKANLKSQKHALVVLQRPAFRALVVASLLPLLVLSIRWRSHTLRPGDDTALGLSLTRFTARFTHASFFGIALWLSLDPTFSPRHLRLGPPMLSYYYLAAMVAGYCAGYFLQMAGHAAEGGKEKALVPPEASPMGDPHAAERRWGKLAAAVVWVALLIMPTVLLWRNVGQIRLTNGPAVREFSRQLWSDLPAGRSVVLSEQADQLVLLRAEVAARGRSKDPLPLETRTMRSVRYQRFMAGQYVSRWPIALPTNQVIGVKGMVRLVSAFAAHDDVVYAHPSSGLFFERFTDQPNGLAHRLVRRGSGETEVELLAPEVMRANEQLWQQRWTGTLRALAEQAAEERRIHPPWVRRVLARMSLRGEPNATASDLGAIYAKSLNSWGVRMQQAGHWPEAGVWFNRALALNPENLSALINAEYNQRYQHGDKTPLTAETFQRKYRELFDSYRNWADILDANGPIDEPTFLLPVGEVFLVPGDYRQASAAFGRSAQLAPGWMEPRLWQALSYVGERNYTGALALTESIAASGQLEEPTGPAQLVMCRTAALRGLGRTNDASACLDGFIRQYGDHEGVLAAAAGVLEENRQYSEELPVVEALLSRDPNNVELLAKKGSCELELARFEAAAATLTQVLARDSSNADARLQRALARLAAGQLDAARADYELLLKTEAYAQNARFGLAAVARRQHDTNAAIELYRQYMENSAPGSREYKAAAARLRRLRAD